MPKTTAPSRRRTRPTISTEEQDPASAPPGGISAGRFKVALSFSGKDRAFVEKIAASLAEKVGQERVLYDHFHKVEFSRARLGQYLTRLYAEASELVVVFVSNRYRSSKWCGLEWALIYDHIYNGHDERVMLVRLNSKTATLDGLPKTAGFFDVNTLDEPPKSIADAILERHAMLSPPASPAPKNKPKGPGRAKTPNDSAGASRDTSAAPPLAKGRKKTHTKDPPLAPSDPEYWNETNVEARLAAILATSEPLATSLDTRLKQKPSNRLDELTLPKRVARRIMDLGKGLKPAHTLTEACYDAIKAEGADAPGEGSTARALLSEWLPYGYRDAAKVVLLRLADGTEDRRNLRATNHREHFVEIYMASDDGRACRFTSARVDGLGGRSVAESMYPAPPGSSQRMSGAAIAQRLVDALNQRFDVRSVGDLKAEFKDQATKHKMTPYLLVRMSLGQTSLPDSTIHSLNELLPHLRVVVLPDEPIGDDDLENELWRWMIKLFAD